MKSMVKKEIHGKTKIENMVEKRNPWFKKFNPWLKNEIHGLKKEMHSL